MQILAGAKTGRARFKTLVVIRAQNDEKRLSLMGGSLVSQSQKCADPRGILSKSEEGAQTARVQTGQARFKNLVVFWAQNDEKKA